jgi:hypothetical protein
LIQLFLQICNAMNVLIELHYLPCVDYFAAVTGGDEIVVERHENYLKQSYRNRCRLMTANGVASLTIPVLHNAGKTLITDLKVDHTQKWLNIHWRTIQSAYGNAPFYEYYSDDLHNLLFKKHEFLYDLNRDLLTLCLSWLKYPGRVRETLAYEKEPAGDFSDMRSLIHPKKACSTTFHNHTPYSQVFGSMFVENLSLIDVIFCLGPDARRYLQEGKSGMNK